jgi:hypothetical protein
MDTVSISSWFIAATKNNYIVDSWLNSTIEYWAYRKNKHTYFWVHKLFTTLYEKNYIIKNMWDKVPKLSSSVAEQSKLNGPHAFVPYKIDLCGKLSIKQKNYIDNRYNNNYCLKLTRHFNIDQQIKNSNSVIHYILHKEELI